MNRRRFLSILAGAGAASATSYFFAPIGGWKSDVIAQPNPQWLLDTRHGLRRFSELNGDDQKHVLYLMRKRQGAWAEEPKGNTSLAGAYLGTNRYTWSKVAS